MSLKNNPFSRYMRKVVREGNLLKSRWRKVLAPDYKTIWWVKLTSPHGDARICPTIELAEAAEKQLAIINKWSAGKKK